MQSYGQPALVKLLNNALGTYNLAATARMLNLSEQLGVAAKGLFEVIGVSTGKSWMSDNFIDVQYDLLLKDETLLRGEIGSLPAADLNDGIERRSFKRVRCCVRILQSALLYFEPDSNEMGRRRLAHAFGQVYRPRGNVVGRYAAGSDRRPVFPPGPNASRRRRPHPAAA